MTLVGQFTQTVQILRAAAASPASVDEWNQPALTTDAVVATMDGEIQPLSMTEVAALTDAGAQVGDFRGFLDGSYIAGGRQVATDVRSSDRIRDVAAAATYEIRSVLPYGPIDYAGVCDHFELLLRRVVD